MRKAKLEKGIIGDWCLALVHLYRSGVPWGDAFALMAEDEPEEELRDLLVHMSERADEGILLAQVLQETDLFPEYVCGLIQVGERTGRMEECLQALSDFYRKRSQTEKRLKTAMMYPLVLLSVLLAVVILLLVWVLPIFGEVYQQLGSQLTGLAGGLLFFGSLLRKCMPVVCVLMALLLAGVLLGFYHEGFQNWLLGIWHKHRGGKGIDGQMSQAHFIQALSLGMQSGMMPQEAVELAKGLVDSSPAFRIRLEDCVARLDAGETLPIALEKTGLLGKADGRLYEYARKAGKGDEMMAQIAERLMEDSEQALEERFARIEPTLIVLMSVLVGAILCSVLLPLIHMMSAIG